MSTFQERLVTEKNELNEKHEKLIQFINTGAYQKISEVQKSLLQVQAAAMFTYAKCLSERIVWLEMEQTSPASTNQ